jgi:hypothetical protein
VKREIHPGVVAGIVAVVAVVVIVFGWKAIAPPAPAGIKSFDKATQKLMQQDHAKSAEEIKQEQVRSLQR